MKMGKHVYCRKAHGAHDLRGPADDPGREGNRRRHPDGQPGPRAARACGCTGSSSTTARSARSARSTSGPTAPARPSGPGGRRASTGPRAAEPVPETLDWDLWLGPARWRPYANSRTAGRRGHLLPVQLARLVGFRLRRDRRHGRAQCRPGVLCPGAWRPDGGRRPKPVRSTMRRFPSGTSSRSSSRPRATGPRSR